MKIKDVIRDISAGDMCVVELHKLCIVITFKTKLTAAKIEKRLIGVVFNDDNRLIVEIGDDYSGSGFTSSVWSYFARNIRGQK